MFSLFEKGCDVVYSDERAAAGAAGYTPSFAGCFAVGGVASAIASIITSPLDVVKTRMQTQSPDSITRYLSVVDGLKTIVRDEGPRALFNGTLARASYFFAAGGLMMGAYGALRGSACRRLGWGPAAAPAAAAPSAPAEEAAPARSVNVRHNYSEAVQRALTRPKLEGLESLEPWPVLADAAGRPPSGAERAPPTGIRRLRTWVEAMRSRAE